MRQHGSGDEEPGRRRGVTGGVAALLAVLACLTGCGSVPYGPARAASQTDAPTSPATAGTQTSPATAGAQPGVPPAGTRAEARALARRLLSELVLPAGARLLPGRPAPGALSQPPYTVGDPDVDLYRLFTLPMPVYAAQQYGQAHPPAGLTFTGVGSFDADVTLEADLPPRATPPGIDEAALLYTIAPGEGNGSLLRADVQVITFPARSAAEYLDTAGVRSVTVSATGGTPHDALRIITSRPEIARLVRLLDGVHAMPPGAMPIGCPAEFSPLPQLTFTPVSAGRPVVDVDPTNCLFDNVFADGVPQPALVDTGLFEITERLLPPASRDVPGS